MTPFTYLSKILKNLTKKQIIPIVVIILSAFLVLDIYASLFSSRVLNNTEFIVEKGDGLNLIVKNLKDSDLIKDDFWFKAYVFLAGKEKDIKAGKYIFEKGDSPFAISSKFISGNMESDDVVFTVPEGFTIFDIDKKLADAGLIQEGDFINSAMNFDNREEKHYFLPNEIISLEGYLFPDTYRISSDSKDRVGELVEKMLNNFESKAVSLIYDSVILSIKNFIGRAKKPNEIVTMASILEKEVRLAKDMSLVSGILWKRLNAGIPLQVDATVIYGVCIDVPKFRTQCDFSRIGVADYLDINSEFNTYENLGLPVGPISNPGIEAIKAAINSKSSNYWFYLSAREDGRTIFSKTLQEHNIAREKYL